MHDRNGARCFFLRCHPQLRCHARLHRFPPCHTMTLGPTLTWLALLAGSAGVEVWLNALANSTALIIVGHPDRIPISFDTSPIGALLHSDDRESVDECYFSEKVLPLYGYSPIGQKCKVTSPATSWKKQSLLLAVASDGSRHSQIIQGVCQ